MRVYKKHHALSTLFVRNLVCMQHCLCATLYATLYATLFVRSIVCMQHCMYATLFVCNIVCMQHCMQPCLYATLYATLFVRNIVCNLVCMQHCLYTTGRVLVNRETKWNETRTKQNGSRAHNNYEFVHLSVRLTAVQSQYSYLRLICIYLPVLLIR